MKQFSSNYLGIVLGIITSSFLCHLNLLAQDLTRIYKTQTVHQRLLANNPEFKRNLQKMERQIANFRMVGLKTEKTIPIVFHIIHNSADERISTAQVYSQIAALNRDFGHEFITELHPAESLAGFSKARPNQTGIKFCLAQIDGQAGIFYVETDQIAFGENDAIKFVRDAEVIEPSNYLNIWVGALADTVSGYSQLPSGNATTDGIVIDYRLVGTMGTAVAPLNNGSTLTHLVGSYLGLYELWNEAEPCGDDGVWDTPIHNAPNNTYIDHYRHVSLCPGNPTEMTMNFMDGTPNAYMFTKGQMRRMNAVLAPNGIRAGLIKGQVVCDNASLVADTAEERNTFKLDKQEPQSILTFSIRPNPVKHQLTVNIHDTSANLIIYSLSGKLLHQTKAVSQLELDVSNWVAGLYYVQVWKDQERITKSFVVSQ